MSNAVSGDAVGLTGQARFADRNAGQNKAGNLSLQLNGSDAGNHVLDSRSAVASAAITPKALTVADIAMIARTYDGNTTAQLSGGVLSGLVGDDAVRVSVDVRLAPIQT